MDVSGQLNAATHLPPWKGPFDPIRYEGECAPEPAWTKWRREKKLYSFTYWMCMDSQV